jgi:hypothetical protein
MTNEYVAASYGVILFGLLMYVVVVGLKSARMAREAELLALLVERADDGGEDPLASGVASADAPDPASRA